MMPLPGQLAGQWTIFIIDLFWYFRNLGYWKTTLQKGIKIVDF